MIQPIPDKKRYQVFMDHGLPGQFEFLEDFATEQEAETHAAHTHAASSGADMVVLDALTEKICLTLTGRRTLSGEP